MNLRVAGQMREIGERAQRRRRSLLISPGAGSQYEILHLLVEFFVAREFCAERFNAIERGDLRFGVIAGQQFLQRLRRFAPVLSTTFRGNER